MCFGRHKGEMPGERLSDVSWRRTGFSRMLYKNGSCEITITFRDLWSQLLRSSSFAQTAQVSGSVSTIHFETFLSFGCCFVVFAKEGSPGGSLEKSNLSCVVNTNNCFHMKLADFCQFPSEAFAEFCKR